MTEFSTDGFGVDINGREDDDIFPGEGLGSVVAAMLQVITIGAQDVIDRACVKPCFHSLNAHLQPVLQHDVDSVCQVEFIFQAEVALHLFIYGLKDQFWVLKVVAANQGKVIFHNLRFFDEVGDPTVFSEVGNTKTAWVGNGFYPGDSTAGSEARKEKSVSMSVSA